MKRKIKFRRRVSWLGTFLVAGAIALLSQCTDETEVKPLTDNSSSGSDVIDTYKGPWAFDKVHSNINWETAYNGENAILTGKFNTFNIDIKFDEKNPSNGKINAWVRLSTFNTGEPGRDGPGKCGPGYMGVKYKDTLYTPDPKTDTAWFQSTSIEAYGDGYIAEGTLTFLGVTKAQKLYFSYMGIQTLPDNKGYKTGFYGQLTFKAQSDYGVSSTSIADEVTLRVGCNLKKSP